MASINLLLLLTHFSSAITISGLNGLNSPIAQLVEQMTVNHWVTGSSPVRGANIKDFAIGPHWENSIMYAVISTGGKQYKVAEGEVIKLEKLSAEAGEIVEFPVLLLANKADLKVGTPFLAESKVKASIVEHGRDDKITVIKFRRRKHHRKQMGHRQHYTAVKITEIL
jgi:large subunit ribosomal protein L21